MALKIIADCASASSTFDRMTSSTGDTAILIRSFAYTVFTSAVVKKYGWTMYAYELPITRVGDSLIVHHLLY